MTSNAQNIAFDNHFARVLPVVGATLRERRVALAGVDAGAGVAALLAACGVVRWALVPAGPAAPDGALVRCFGRRYAGRPAHVVLAEALRNHHGAGLPWEFASWPGAAPSAAAPDLVVAAGAEAALTAGLRLARQANCPLVWLRAPAPDDPDAWATGYPVAPISGAAAAYATPDPFAAAAVARALLLRGTPSDRPDLHALLGGPPGAAENVIPRAAFHTPYDAPALRESTALIVGCGSLGSLIARDLATVVRRLVLADGGMVSVFNPARQLYPAARAGQPKAIALCAELSARLGPDAPDLTALASDLDDEAQVADLAARYQPAIAVVATGSHADFALGRGLRAAGVAHLVGRCYPRARYWEAIVVADAAAPCLGCLRGQLYTGPQPAPTPEEAARYTAPGDLQGEPATLIESGWAAACMSRLALQLLAPPGLREGWFADLLAQQQTCLIGGAYAERTSVPDEPAAWAYGIARPGQVRAYGLAEVIGSAATRVCGDCGRQWAVRYRVRE